MAGSIVQEVRVYNSGSALTNFQVSLPNPVINEDGLIGHWPLNESSGQVAYDRSTYRMNLTFTGTSRNTGKQDSAIEMSGTAGQHSTTTDINSTHLETRIATTLAAWVYIDANPTGDLAIIYKKQFHFFISPTRKLGGYNSGLTGMVAADFSNATLPLSTWTHVAITYDVHTGLFRHYINGVLDKSTSYGGFMDSVSATEIGGQTFNSRYFDGRFQDLRVYNRALADEEITALYNLPLLAKIDYKDVKFFADQNQVTELGWWREHSGKWWVKVPSIAASPALTKIYCSYADLSATDTSSGANTFELFDDFPGPSLSAQWASTLQNGGTRTFNENGLRLQAANGHSAISRTTSDIANSTYIESNIRLIGAQTNWRHRPFQYTGQPADFVIVGNGAALDMYWGTDTTVDIPRNTGHLISTELLGGINISHFGEWYLNKAASAPTFPLNTNITVGDSASTSFGGDIAVAWWRVRKSTTNTVNAFYAGQVGYWVRPITINNAGSTLTNQQINLIIPSVINDIEFYSDIQGTQSIPYWKESTGNYWIKLSSLPNGNTTIYAFEGVDSNINRGDPLSVFEFFDNFDGRTLNSSKWNINDSGSHSFLRDGFHVKGFLSTWTESLHAIQTFNRSSQAYSVYFDWTPIYGTYLMFGWHDSGVGSSYTDLVYAHYPYTNANDIFEDGTGRGAQGFGVDNRISQRSRVDLLSTTGAVYRLSFNKGKDYRTLYTSAYSSENNLKPSIPNYNKAFSVKNVFVTKYTTNTITYTVGELNPLNSMLNSEFNISFLSKDSSSSHQFSLPVSSSVLNTLLIWPYNKEHQDLGIPTFSFQKGSKK